MIKRLFDIVASVLGLLVLSPVIIIVAWQIRKKLGSPVLFRQVGPGRDGKSFEMIKLCTMSDVMDVQELYRAKLSSQWVEWVAQ